MPHTLPAYLDAVEQGRIPADEIQHRTRLARTAFKEALAEAVRAEVKGFNEGIEAAAKWHDEQATIFDPVDAESASDHRVYATAIRALTRPAPATGQDTPPGESDV